PPYSLPLSYFSLSLFFHSPPHLQDLHSFPTRRSSDLSLHLPTQVAHYLAANRGVRCDPSCILIVSGTQHGLRLCIDALLAPGDADRKSTRLNSSHDQISYAVFCLKKKKKKQKKKKRSQ